ncbi:ankyrin repeat domain-containing protein [Nocardia crassostreae]|uniref:ankyrin repeat domain-containing protein n=1 Tax=Nocardia crassostreae TaxID=53428 RepID=UPI00082A1037|nr:ankyrin repeat domain-containing protein [Nocardia crassostreae]
MKSDIATGEFGRPRTMRSRSSGNGRWWRWGGTADGCFALLFGGYQAWIQERMEQALRRHGIGALAEMADLVRCGADPNQRDPGTQLAPLHRAVQGKRADIAEALLSVGDDIAAHAERFGTPLRMACAMGTSDIVRVLLRYGADPAAGPDRPLHVAAEYGRAEIVGILLFEGVEVDFRDGAGRTALHVAAANGQSGVVTFLLAAGADRDVVNKRGRTPAQEAMAQGHFGAAMLLA